MAEDDALERNPIKFSIAERIRSAAPTAVPPDGEAAKPWASGDAPPLAVPVELLPKVSDDYVPFARVSNAPEITLHLMKKDGSFEGFAYGDLARIRLVPADQAGGGLKLVLRFNTVPITDVHLDGVRLNQLHVYLSQHRVFWVREHPRGAFADPTATVISKITLVEAER